MKNIAVLGSTGSIGTQTLDIISRHSHRYRASVLVAGSRVDDLIEQARRHKPDLAIIAREDLYERLSSALAPLGIETAAGSKAIADAVTGSNVDTVVTATVGYSGLEPTVAAIKAGKDIALANKETMVVAAATSHACSPRRRQKYIRSTLSTRPSTSACRARTPPL